MLLLGIVHRARRRDLRKALRIGTYVAEYAKKVI